MTSIAEQFETAKLPLMNARQNAIAAAHATYEEHRAARISSWTAVRDFAFQNFENAKASLAEDVSSSLPNADAERAKRQQEYDAASAALDALQIQPSVKDLADDLDRDIAAADANLKTAIRGLAAMLGIVSA